MSDWRVAKGLLTLRAQLNAKFPGRSVIEDGTIGDERHQATHSEHNPDRNGVVRAMDITNDPRHGLVARDVAQALLDSRDPRLLYVISNAQICSSVVDPWHWRPYNKDPHDKHFHISVVEAPSLYDSTVQWRLEAGPINAHPTPVFKNTKIICTEFGGDGDTQRSAYGPMVDPTLPGFSLPFHFEGNRPVVRAVYNGRDVLAPVIDVGPWFPSSRGMADPYWIAGTRPRADTLPNSNHAGIDATPRVFDIFGVGGRPGTRTITLDYWELVDGN